MPFAKSREDGLYEARAVQNVSPTFPSQVPAADQVRPRCG
jgi:hypothetical protein